MGSKASCFGFRSRELLKSKGISIYRIQSNPENRGKALIKYIDFVKIWEAMVPYRYYWDYKFQYYSESLICLEIQATNRRYFITEKEKSSSNIDKNKETNVSSDKPQLENNDKFIEPSKNVQLSKQLKEKLEEILKAEVRITVTVPNVVECIPQFVWDIESSLMESKSPGRNMKNRMYKGPNMHTSVRGRISGATMTRAQKDCKGSIPRHQKSADVREFQRQVNTPSGSCGIKVTYMVTEQNDANNRQRYNNRQRSPQGQGRSFGPNQSGGNFSGPRPERNFGPNQSGGNFSGPRPERNFGPNQSGGNFNGPRPERNFGPNQSGGNFNGPRPERNFGPNQPRNLGNDNQSKNNENINVNKNNNLNNNNSRRQS